MTVLPITTEYIKLQDLMKLADLVSTRGKKLRPGDVVAFAGRELTVEYAT